MDDALSFYTSSGGADTVSVAWRSPECVIAGKVIVESQPLGAAPPHLRIGRAVCVWANIENRAQTLQANVCPSRQCARRKYLEQCELAL